MMGTDTHFSQNIFNPYLVESVDTEGRETISNEHVELEI
jgi:hypothetical protein